jgi:hypothetical protein
MNDKTELSIACRHQLAQPQLARHEHAFSVHEYDACLGRTLAWPLGVIDRGPGG